MKSACRSGFSCFIRRRAWWRRSSGQSGVSARRRQCQKAIAGSSPPSRCRDRAQGLPLGIPGRGSGPQPADAAPAGEPHGRQVLGEEVGGCPPGSRAHRACGRQGGSPARGREPRDAPPRAIGPGGGEGAHEDRKAFRPRFQEFRGGVRFQQAREGAFSDAVPERRLGGELGIDLVPRRERDRGRSFPRGIGQGIDDGEDAQGFGRAESRDDRPAETGGLLEPASRKGEIQVPGENDEVGEQLDLSAVRRGGLGDRCVRKVVGRDPLGWCRSDFREERQLAVGQGVQWTLTTRRASWTSRSRRTAPFSSTRNRFH